MTLSNAESREPAYTGDGAHATYAFSFPVYSASDLQVTVATNASPPAVSTLVLTTNYTVTLASSTLPSAGTITLVAGNLTSGYILSIRRVLPLTQLTNLVNEGSFFGLTHEKKFDMLVMGLQQLYDLNKRSLRLPEYEAGTSVLTELPSLGSRKGFYVYFDGTTGNVTGAVQSSLGGATTTAYTLTLLDDANASAARDTLGATSGQWPTALIIDKNVTAAKLASDAIAQIFQARLTLTANTPVTVSDVTAATTVRVSRYGGDKIALYDGTDWRLFTLSADVTLAVPNTTDTMYDLFIYDSSGTLTLDAVAWTNDTTRATALATQNGVYVKNAATGRRYVGSFRTTGVAGNTEDSATKRYIWNYYNRVTKRLAKFDTTDTWAYTTDTWRQANGSTANQVEVVIGVEEDMVEAQVIARFSNTNLSVRGSVGIGVDSTTASSTSISAAADSQVANEPVTAMAFYRSNPGVGQHELVWLERSEATGTTTWQGDNGLLNLEVRSGIAGSVRC